jgi:DNA-binding response OmpR family regulator
VLPRRALVVEDDTDIVELVTHYLGRDGWEVEAVASGRVALERIRRGGYRLIVLDIQLPEVDGLTLCVEARRSEASRQAAIIMLTARGDETDRIVGLETGADDYVVKPFSPKELVARVRAVLRRLDGEAVAPDGSPLVFGPVEIDRARHLVRSAGEPVHLTAKEFALLVALVEARGRVLSRQSLLERVWGYSYSEGTRTVDVHVRRLREKLPALAPFILTVTSVGYRLAQEGD